MGKQAREKANAKGNLIVQRTMGYLDPQFYSEPKEQKEIIFDSQLKKDVFKAYGSNIDMTEIQVEPFSVELGGYWINVQKINDVFVCDLHITTESEGRLVISFGETLVLKWNEREIIDSNNFVVTNIPKWAQDFITLPALSAAVIYSVLGINKGLAKESSSEDTIPKKELRTPKRENFNVEVADGNKEGKKSTADSKEPVYVKESWKVAAYKRKDGTPVSGYESNRDPNLLKKVENQ